MPRGLPTTSDLFDRDPARLAVLEWLAGNKRSMRWLSEALGRNPTYIQQYLRYGEPEQIDEDTRPEIARTTGISEDVLRGARRNRSRSGARSIASVSGKIVRRGVPDDAIIEAELHTGAGAGGLISAYQADEVEGTSVTAEQIRDYWRLPEWLLRSRLNARPQHIVCFPTQGDSMAPTIADGDVVFVDVRHRVPSPPGVYVLADAFGGVIVKRLEVVSKPRDEDVMVRVASDNPRHETQTLGLDEIHIIGRYVGRFTPF